MIHASTYEKLKALNCSAMADEFQSQINDSKSYNLLGFEERPWSSGRCRMEQPSGKQVEKSYQESDFLCFISMY